VSNRHLPISQTISAPLTEDADPLSGLDSPEAIEALERAAEELVKGSNLDPGACARPIGQ